MGFTDYVLPPLEGLGWAFLNYGLNSLTSGNVAVKRGPEYGTHEPVLAKTLPGVAKPDASAVGKKRGAPAVILINIHPLLFFLNIVIGGELELGESYTRRVWYEEAPTTTLYDILEGLAVLSELSEKLDFLKYFSFTWWDRFFSFSKRFGALDKKQSADSIAEHYDDGNKLFRKFLGEDMVYTSGSYWQYAEDNGASFGNGLDYLSAMPEAKKTRSTRVQSKANKISLSLEQAQKLKVERLLDLAGSDATRLMDIGSGWGYLVHAAKERGYDHAVGLCNCKSMVGLAKEKYGDNYSMLDYRDVPKTNDYDVVTAVEMIEAVPAKHYPDFVNCCDRALKPGGRVVMQVIHAFAFNNSVARSRDPLALGTFVTTHIFPGQQIPNLDFLHEAFLKSGKFKRVYTETTGHDYAQTLRQWRLRLDGPSKDGFVIPDHIQRKYRYYLAWCEAGFNAELLHVSRIVFEKKA